MTILKSGKFTFQAQVKHLKNSLNSAPSSVSTRTCESERLKLLFPNHTSPIQAGRREKSYLNKFAFFETLSFWGAGEKILCVTEPFLETRFTLSEFHFD